MKNIKWMQILLNRFRLVGAILTGVIVFFIFNELIHESETRFLMAWNSGVILYLVLAIKMIYASSAEHTCKWARMEDDGAQAVLIFALVAVVASLVAIIMELASIKNYKASTRIWHVILAGLTIFCSWCLVHTSFAIHYARKYYDPKVYPHHVSLKFPEVQHPDYVDFLYFSFVIGMTSQTSDVALTTRTMRNLALLHGIIAFFFNTIILAMTIDIAASFA